MNAPSLVARRVLIGFVAALALAFTASLTAQIPARNVNMVSGLVWPGGDPWLQRQNEPSIAASTRNPLHLLAGSNDYRSIDLAGVLGSEETGDAWAGLYMSTDGGERWTSTLVPGFPHDPDPRGQASPLYGYHAAADPVVRAGTNGLMYFAGLAFDRTTTGFGKSAIYVARFIDNNNQEAVHPFEYVNTSLVASQAATSNVFLDKPWMAVDIPRQGAGTCNITTVNEHGPFTQQLPAGNVYVAFTVKSVDAQGDRWDLYFSRSTDCGVHFSTPARLSRAQDRVNQGASIVISPTTGAVYISWRRIDLNATDGLEEHAIVVAKSVDQGKQFNNPGVARRFPRGKKKGLNPTAKPGNGKQNSIQASEEFELAPFDQSTSDVNKQFRTNAYPTMAADGTGRLYLAWTERGFASERSDPAEGDARILITTSADGVAWEQPSVVSDGPLQQGHQLMPALSFAGGKLMLLYYDLQEDRSQVFSKYVDDKTAIANSNPVRRHTFDVRTAMASPGQVPTFAASQSVSSYLRGTRSATGPIEQLQVNPPNLPMFKLGTVPFIGDYIDIGAAPAFVPNGSGGWTYNTAPTSTPPVFHAVWTDNRDVKPPYTKDWRDYTPPNYTGPRPDEGAEIIVCLNGLAGSRNQNIYTARITGGLVVGSPQNSKQLSPTLQRAFVVFANNTVIPTDTDNGTRYYRMTVLNQPPGGRASFNQYPLPPFTAASEPPLISIDITVPAFTTASRTVYVTSSDPHAPVNVDVSEIPSIGAPLETPGGLEGTIRLNADILNPEVDNPEVDNPEVDNPEVDNAEVYNPEVDNPEVDNPEVDNPEVDNPEVDNPEVDNIVVGNPEVDNPEVDNPEVDNPEVDNPEVDNPEVDNAQLIAGGGVITDITWTIKNVGNTTTAYNVNLFNRHNTSPTDKKQLLIYRVYKTPIIKAASCDVKTVTQNVLIANIPDPALVPPGGEPANPNDSARTNATLWIEPEQEVRVTLRVFDPIKADNININGQSIDPDWVPESDVSLFAQSQPVNTPDAPTIDEPPLVGPDPDPLTLTVTSTADAGPGSLREAMTLADAMPGRNVIEFDLPGAVVHTISLVTLLPGQEESVVIDGSTQPGYAGVPMITIDGTAIAGGGSGFRLRGGGSLIRGLAIGGFGDHGIWFDNFGSNEAYGNYVGFDATGTTALHNGNGSVMVGSANNRVGSHLAGDRNVIGNGAFYGVYVDSPDNRIEANYIGTDVTGNVAAAQLMGLMVSGAGATGNVIGGNVISGNALYGVAVNAPGNLIEKNTIGLNAASDAALPQSTGVLITDAINNRIIDNLVSGHLGPGIRVERNTADPTGTEITGNRIGMNGLDTAAIPNNMGIEIAGASNVTIGGVGAARNQISGNTVDGINLNRMNAAPNLPATFNVIKGNYIGLNNLGTAAIPNGFAGISITHGSNNTIGGANFLESNVISGNAGPGIAICCGSNLTNNVVIRNFIGLNATGTAAIGNGGSGISLGGAGVAVSNTRIGGANETNVISGNAGSGIQLNGAEVTGTVIHNNMIGTALDLVTDLGNGQNGITINASDGTTIGGLTHGNLLSGNAGYGVAVFGGPNTTMDENFVGVADGGAVAVPNDAGGILVTGAGATNFRIGDAAGNLVSGNGGFAGIAIQDTPAGFVSRNRVGLNNLGTAALPNNNNGIDADNVGATVFDLNTVSGNTGNGIYVVASNGATLRRNIVGLDYAGGLGIGNGANGIFAEFQSGTIIGGTLIDGNLVGGNGAAGIRLNSAGSVTVSGNKVGTDVTGLSRWPNAAGVHVTGPTSNGIIGGNIAAANVISGNSGAGVWVQDANGLTVEGNYIGIAANESTIVPNNVGVQIDGGTVHVGSPAAGRYNVIAFNTSHGMLVTGGTALNRIDSNFIGVNSTLTVAAPNGGDGIRIQGGRPRLLNGIISNNAGNGVTITGGVTGVLIPSRIYNNGGLAIDLGNDGVTANDPSDADNGPNGLQNYPDLTLARTNLVTGTINSAPSTSFVIRIYVTQTCDASGFGEGAVLARVAVSTTDASGNGTFSAGGLAIPLGSFVTATAQSSLDTSTSEFSSCLVISPGGPLSLTVTNTNDAGAGSLREAIQTANVNAGFANTIGFNIAGPGPFSIAPATALPLLQAPMVLDATTQPGYAGAPIVELNGAGAPIGSSGFEGVAGNTRIKGFVINRFQNYGIYLRSAGNNVIQGNWVGLDLSGSLDVGNVNGGVQLDDGSLNLVGGAAAGEMNVISGNGQPSTPSPGLSIRGGANHLVVGNRVGTDATGTASVPNEGNAINLDTSNSTIGGVTVAERNLISGNGSAASVALGSYSVGVSIFGFGTGNRVIGNWIGTDVTGVSALGNTGSGVGISGTDGHFVGGAGAGEGNVISGNGAGPAFGHGVEMVGAANNRVEGNHIGTDASGSVAVPNLHGGIRLHLANDNSIGGDTPESANVIAFNTGIGVAVVSSGGPSGVRNQIQTNSIFGNTGLDIDLEENGVTPNDAGDGDAGANDLQNYPVITSAVNIGPATIISGTFNSTPNQTFLVALYSSQLCNPSGFGGGATQRQTFLVATDGAGNAVINTFLPNNIPSGWFITATASSNSGVAPSSTSEFSQCRAVTP